MKFLHFKKSHRTFREKFGRDVEFFGSPTRPKKRSFGKLFLILGCMFAGIVLCVGIFFVSTLFRVKTVSAAEGKYYTAEVLLYYAEVEQGDLLAGFDASAVEKRLKAALPLIESARVRKHLNGKVSIQVTEVDELYYTCHNVNYYILDAEDMRVLGVFSNPQEAQRVGAVYIGLPETARVRVGDRLSFINLPYAPESTPDELTTYEVETDEPAVENAYVLDFMKALMESPLAPRVTGMEMGDRYDLSFVLDGHILVSVGSMKELDRKLSMTSRSLEAQPPPGGGMNTLVDVSDPARIIHRTSPDVILPPWATVPGAVG